MIRFEDLIIMNEATIIYLTKLGKSIQRNSIIREMLKDRAVFKKLPKEDALIVLLEIGIGEQNLNSAYNDLI